MEIERRLVLMLGGGQLPGDDRLESRVGDLCPFGDLGDDIGELASQVRPLKSIIELTRLHGRTFIAQAAGLHACACGKSVLYMSVTTWLENLALARSSGTYLRYRDKLAKPDLIIIDDFGMRKLSSTEAQDLCELLEERSIGKSTVFTTQLPLDHWSEVIADPVIADAIRDRLEHAALTIHITGESYRGVKARKLASRKKDA
jgi:IstB-like ATP binding protein